MGVGGCVSGDVRCFELYRTYWARALREARRINADQDVGEDLAQEAMLKLLRHPPVLEDSRRFEGALIKTVRNLGRNRLRDERRRLALLAREVAARPSAQQPCAEERKIADVGRLLGKALRDLPGRMRRVYVLRVLHRIPTAEIAEHLGTSPQTIRNQVARAGRRLRESALRDGWLPR